MADDRNSIMFSNTNRLLPNKSTGTKPRIDGFNFSGITENTLKLREYKGQYGGGRLGGAWWSIWILIMSSIIMLGSDVLALITGEPITGDWFLGVIAMLAAVLAFSPFFILWRREVPVCFNRKTRKVSFWIKGQLAQVDWDEIEAYTKLSRSAAAGSGALVKEQLIAFNIFITPVSVAHNVTIPGTDYWDKDDPVMGAKGLWEYIYLFMEKGIEGVPEPKNTTRICSLKESMIDTNPYPIKDVHIIGIIINTILLPFTVPFAIINVITDMVYCVLDIILPRRKPPKPLREACEAE